MADDLESLRQEIFRVHGIFVGKDDPIMILFTLNNRLLAEGAKAQEEQLEQFKSELEGIAYQWGNDAKEKAERILNASLTASKEAMASLMKASASEAAKTMQAEFDKALRRAEAPAQTARNLVVLNVAASVITLAAALLVVWSSLH
ncbi:conjugal transfer protein TraM [Pseudomonas fragi]|uniref:conjugal transfer protein TraM n=1 Tax=Pseudomonas TaxID=286 RepID=UPI00193B8345|nr:MULTISPECIES: conjugal transfer protein TraM [Pseudomonas]MBM1202351.1 conjugal transfer protein TraM [Pseudomonas fragi]MDY7572673.1 conjugal transfer protein TraM [Pseudomonas sp. CCC4.1]MEB0143193.1 conjugal transfer protein TraM [Pseudomonas sp. CCC4.1]